MNVRVLAGGDGIATARARVWLACALMAGLASSSAASRPALTKSSVSRQNVQRTIAGAVKYLYSAANKDGIWDDPSPPGNYGLSPLAKGYYVYSWGGKTALVLHALATAGEYDDPRFAKALAWLMKQKLVSTYSVSCRLQLLHQLPEGMRNPDVLKRDADLLVRGARQWEDRLVWNYVPAPAVGEPRVGDFSNVNYAVLGLWAAGDEGYHVPDRIWQGLERLYVHEQHDDGGWSYFFSADQGLSDQKATAGGMTAAGLASLYLIADRLYARRGAMESFRSGKAYQAIESGMDWMAKRFNASTNPGREGYYDTYYFYNCERVGAAAGLKYFGKHDWFREISVSLLNKRGRRGAIVYGKRPFDAPEIVHTAFALQFLAKGSAPIIVNKLQHSGDWNNHIRELAALSDWMARQTERPANWQVVSLQGDPEDLTDSRILYIAGGRPLKLTADERAKLKRFVELGGLLVFHPDSTAPGFLDSVRKLLRELWPHFVPKDVDLSTHPLGKIYLPMTNDQARLEELTSPTRVLAFILHGFPANAWEQRLYDKGKPMFVLGANLHYFANDRAPFAKLPGKLRYFAQGFRDDPPKTDRKVKLARIKYSDYPHLWNPEPAAMEHFARQLAARANTTCEIEVVAPEELARSGAKVAHLAGVGAYDFPAEQWDAIDAWLRAGGTLIVDQAGGPRPDPAGTFDSAFRELLAKRYGAEALESMSAADPLLRGIGKVSLRRARGVRHGKMWPRLEAVYIDGRAVIIYSRYDLTCGLLGAPNPLAVGADAEGAYTILSHLLGRLTAKPAPTTRPASEPK